MNRDDFYDQLTDKFDVIYFPYYKIFFNYLNNIDIKFYRNLIETFKQKQKNANLEIDKQTSEIIDEFFNFYNNIKLSNVDDIDIIKLHAEISDDKIKLVSNKNLILEAKGICNYKIKYILLFTR